MLPELHLQLPRKYYIKTSPEHDCLLRILLMHHTQPVQNRKLVKCVYVCYVCEVFQHV